MRRFPLTVFLSGLLFLAGTAGACLPGGVVREGGYADHLQLIPAATQTHGATYKVICYDQAEIKRRKALKERNELEIRSAREAGKTPPEPLDLSTLNPPFRLVEPAAYRGECDQQGQHSVFYLFHFARVTPPLDPERAITEAVQRLEGDTMVGIRAWHETHYYSILGMARVYKVRGTVVKFDTPASEEPPVAPAAQPARRQPGGRR